ncbi:MAG: YicC/YloC family endoribonuclease [Bacillota bacterium]|nr:YicC/YloC family endoribonuclease [Bacillota bacterium]
MLQSMTGYGRGEAEEPYRKFTVELKAVNHRFSEVVVRLPRSMMALEDRIRRVVLEHISRGRVDVFLNVDEGEGRPIAVKVDKDLALAYYKAMKDLQGDLGLSGVISLDHLIAMPQIFLPDEPKAEPEEWWPAIEQALRQACGGLVVMRREEGAVLASDLDARLAEMEDMAARIKERVPEVAAAYRERLEQRLQELAGDLTIDPARLAQEVAFFAERADITEELVRLASHLRQARDCLAAEGPVGRRLDFLAQEMFREVNTIGSKAQDEAIAKLVVELKIQLEKVREQVQNVE